MAEKLIKKNWELYKKSFESYLQQIPFHNKVQYVEISLYTFLDENHL